MTVASHEVAGLYDHGVGEFQETVIVSRCSPLSCVRSAFLCVRIHVSTHAYSIFLTHHNAHAPCPYYTKILSPSKAVIVTCRSTAFLDYMQNAVQFIVNQIQ